MNRLLRISALLMLIGSVSGCGTAGPGSADTSTAPATPVRSTDFTGNEASSGCESCEGTSPPGDDDTQQESAEVLVAENSRITPPDDDRIVDATFDDLNCSMQEDIVFRPWMITERADELNGRRIRIAGYMLPDLKQKGIKEFVLLKNTQCKFGPGGQADHLIRITLVDGVSTSYRGDIPLEVVGRLSINPFLGVDGNTWSIYDLDGESVRKYQR